MLEEMALMVTVPGMDLGAVVVTEEVEDGEAGTEEVDQTGRTTTRPGTVLVVAEGAEEGGEETVVEVEMVVEVETGGEDTRVL